MPCECRKRASQRSILRSSPGVARVAPSGLQATDAGLAQRNRPDNAARLHFKNLARWLASRSSLTRDGDLEAVRAKRQVLYVCPGQTGAGVDVLVSRS